MLFLIIIPLILYFCLPKDLQEEVADWGRLLIGIAIGLSAIVWVVSLLLQFLFGTPAMDNLPEW